MGKTRARRSLGSWCDSSGGLSRETREACGRSSFGVPGALCGIKGRSWMMCFMFMWGLFAYMSFSASSTSISIGICIFASTYHIRIHTYINWHRQTDRHKWLAGNTHRTHEVHTAKYVTGVSCRTEYKKNEIYKFGVAILGGVRAGYNLKTAWRVFSTSRFVLVRFV